MWVQATARPSASTNSVRRRAQTRRQPDDPGRADELVADPNRPPRPSTSAARTSQVSPRSRVPRPVEAALRRVEPGQVLGVAQQHRRPQPPVRAASSNRTRNGAEQRSGSRPGSLIAAPASSSSVSSVHEPRAVVSARSGARAGPRTTARRRTRRARRRARSSSSAACVRASSSWCRTSALMPRAPHLQSYASAAPSRSTVTSYGWISARTPSNRIRRSRRTAAVADAPGEQEPRGQLLDDRAADLAADLLAALGDLERRGQDGLGRARARRRRHRRAEEGREHGRSSRAASVVSPFITARASTRWAGVGVGQQVGGAGDERVGLDARIDDGPPVTRRVLEPHGVSPRATSVTCGNVDSQSIARCGSSIRPISSIAAIDRGDGLGVEWLVAARRADRLEPRAPGLGQVGDVRPLVLDLLAQLGEGRVGVDGALDGGVEGVGARDPCRKPTPAATARQRSGGAAIAGCGVATGTAGPADPRGRSLAVGRSARRSSASRPPARPVVPGARIGIRGVGADAGCLARVRREPRARRPGRGSRDTGRGALRRESSAPSSPTMATRWSGWE